MCSGSNKFDSYRELMVNGMDINYASYAIPIAIYSISSVLDVSMTYLYVAVLGVYREANPNNMFIHNPFAWIATDMLLILSTAYLFSNIARDEKSKKVSQISLYSLAILRALPVIHNFLLLNGIESLLPRLLYGD